MEQKTFFIYFYFLLDCLKILAEKLRLVHKSPPAAAIDSMSKLYNVSNHSYKRPFLLQLNDKQMSRYRKDLIGEMQIWNKSGVAMVSWLEDRPHGALQYSGRISEVSPRIEKCRSPLINHQDAQQLSYENSEGKLN